MRGNNYIAEKMRTIGSNRLAISVITAGELLWGARNKRELQTINKSLSSIRNISLNEDICNLFLDISNKYCLTHNIGIPDSFIAATAVFYDLQLFTLNIKDFSFIEGINLFDEIKSLDN